VGIFTFEETRQFTPGAMGEAYIPLTLLPLLDVRGPGSRVFSQLATFGRPLTQAPGVPQAWNGEISGQFVLQPLVDNNSGGPGA
jgi:hypothetical protein